MAEIVLDSPYVEGIIPDMVDLGYVLRHEEQSVQANGVLYTTKIFFCERNKVQVVLQTCKLTDVIENNIDNQTTEVKINE